MEVIETKSESAVESFIGKPGDAMQPSSGDQKNVISPIAVISDVISDVTAGVKTWGFQHQTKGSTIRL
jgi:hypothetical protein